MRTPLIAANWKMNLGAADAQKFISAFVPKVEGIRGVQVLLAPQAPLLPQLVSAVKSTPIQVAAQNCGADKSGAYTGDVSPVLLHELGVKWVILGHSERRHVFGETDSLIQARLKAALKETLSAILCVGETLEERKKGETLKVVARQLGALQSGTWVEGYDFKNFAVAYEPVWAIGTGETATPAQAQEVHHFIRGWLTENVGEGEAQVIRIQYGGSVKPDSAEALMSEKDVDGLLVGSASLKPEVFAEIVQNAVKSGSDWKNDKDRFK